MASQEPQPTPADDQSAWMEQWHRGGIAAPRSEGQSAADWQAELFDELVRRDPVEAFGVGALQDTLWEFRVELARRYARRGTLTVDVGSGNGHVARSVASFSDGPVVGMDVSAECVRYAAEHNAHPSVSYLHSSVEDFTPEQPAGLVTMYEVLEHVDTPVEVLKHVRSWLQPGGHVIISTPNRSSLNRRLKTLPGLRWIYSRFSALDADAAHAGHVEEYHYRELVQMVEDAGLELVKAHGVVLLMPFPGAIKPLARSKWFSRLNARSGDWYPPLAGAASLAARNPGV
jgi:2-polyprenyl-3-methyl-5-hydroxy-6-metoxy-1,4-benzoquinol methylase